MENTESKPVYRQINDLKGWSESITLPTGRECTVAVSPDGKEMARLVAKEINIVMPDTMPTWLRLLPKYGIILPTNDEKLLDWRSNLHGIAELLNLTIRITPNDWLRVEREVNDWLSGN